MGLQQIEGRYDQGKFDPVELIKQFNQQGVRYILIGRQAVVQYGAPLFSLDYDFWVLPEDREKTYLVIESMGLTAKYRYTDKKPLDIFSDDYGNKVDVFFVRTIENRTRNFCLDFDPVYSRCFINKDPDSDFYVRIPCIDDLILLKQVAEQRPKDEEDIEYLMIMRQFQRNPEGY